MKNMQQGVFFYQHTAILPISASKSHCILMILLNVRMTLWKWQCSLFNAMQPFYCKKKGFPLQFMQIRLTSCGIIASFALPDTHTSCPMTYITMAKEKDVLKPYGCTQCILSGHYPYACCTIFNYNLICHI